VRCAASDPKLRTHQPIACRIEKINFDQSSHIAQIYFTKPQAAKTALMLNGGTLENSHLTVTSDSVQMDEPDSHHSDHAHTPPEQSDKPRVGSTSLDLIWGRYSWKLSVVAEILARGYALSDNVVNRAIEYDKQQVR
jgi:hypothetical protein